MTRKASASITIVVLAIMGYIVVGSMARVRKQCEVCVEFNGRRYCGKAKGADDKESKQAATTVACGNLAQGMDETIRCQNTPPVSATCTTS